MLTARQLEEIEKRLLEIPALSDSFQARESAFADKLSDWLSRSESSLVNNRLPSAGSLAALRTVLRAADRGVVPEGVTIHGRMTMRKIRVAAASLVLRHATDVLVRTIEADRERHREAAELAKRMVALAEAKDLAGFGFPHAPPLEICWHTLRTDEDLRGGAVQLEGMVGKNDALILLDRAMSAKKEE